MARLLARAIENNKPNHFFQVAEATPFCQLADVIFADQAVNRRITFELPNLLDCVDGIGRCGRRSSQSSMANPGSFSIAA